MKIRAVTGYAVHSGIRNLFIVQIETDTGLIGLGEGGMSGREWSMQVMVDHCAQSLVGKDPRRIEHLWQECSTGVGISKVATFWARSSPPSTSRWDINVQALGVPGYQLLGGACRERVPCFATPGALTGPEIVDHAQAHVD